MKQIKRILGNEGKYELVDGRKIPISEYKTLSEEPIMELPKPVKPLVIKKRGRRKKNAGQT